MSEVSRKLTNAACGTDNPCSASSRLGNRAELPFYVRARRLAITLALLPALVGCSPWQLAKRTLYGELAEFPQVTEGRVSCQQYQRWAKVEWKNILSEHTGEPYSSDYASGFIQGFVDMVYAGGDAHPPAMPPRRYWRIGYRNGEGRQAVENWYNGFDHGANVAKENGYRERAVIPSSVYMDSKSSPAERPLDWDGEQLFHDADGMTQQGPTPAGPPATFAEPLPNSPANGVPAGGSENIESVPDIPAPANPIPNGSSPEIEPIPVPSTLPMGSAESSAVPNDRAVGGEVNRVTPVSHESEADTPLPPETSNEGPPRPPWQAQPAPSQPTAADSRVVPASHNQKATGSDEYDPFQGSLFGELSTSPEPPAGRVSRAADDRNSVRSGTDQSSRSGPPLPPSRRASAGTPETTDDSSENLGGSSSINVRPLEVLGAIPDGGSRLELAVPGQTLGIAPLYESPGVTPVNESVAIEPPTAIEAPIRSAAADNADEATGAATTSSEPVGPVPGPANPDSRDGWQAKTPTEAETEWRSVR